MKNKYNIIDRDKSQLHMLRVLCITPLLLIWSILSINAQCDIPANRASSNATPISIDLSWDAATGANSYTVFYRVLGATSWISADAPANITTLVGLLSGTTYEWKVQSVCTSGRSSFTIPAILFSTTGPAACATPTTLSVSNVTDVSMLLNWANVTGAVSYIIFYRKISVSTWTQTTSVNSDKNLTGLTPETQYVWKVRAVCAADNSLLSKFTKTRVTKTLAVCPTPSNLSATNITDNTADLDWDDVTGAGTYTVQYRVRGVSTWTTSSVGTSNVSVTGLSAGLNHQWRVRAVCPGPVNSAYTDIMLFKTTGTASCPTPSNMISSNATDNTIDLDWDAVGTAISYSVQHRVLGASNWTTNPSATNSITLTGLEPGLNYQWKVQTECSQIVVSGYSSPLIFATTGTPNCQTPTNLVSSNITDTGADLGWNVAGGAISYIVEYKILGAPDWIETNAVTNSVSLSGLLSGQTYQYRVRSFCSNEIVSAFSDSEFFTTTGTPSCAVPSNRQTSVITNNSAQISWDVVTGALNYVIQFHEIGNPIWTEVSTASTSTTLAGLNSATAYEWKVRSICSADNSLLSVFSSTLVFTTTAAPANFEDSDIAILNMQGNLIYTSAGSQSVTELIQSAGLQPGFYIIQVNKNNKITTQRIAVL